MSRASVKPPEGWGDDALTGYLDDFRGNQFATFDGRREAVRDLIQIDSLYLRFLHGAINPRPVMPMAFFLRAHSAYRVATGAVLSGQLYEAQALLRLCLEHGAYGFYIGPDEQRAVRWLQRHDSPDAKQTVRNEFSIRKISHHIHSQSQKIGGHFDHLYEQLIDFGAHPNERGFSMSSAMRKVDGSVHLDAIYLHDDGLPLALGLKTTAQVGLWTLHAAQLIYPEKFGLLGITDDLAELRQRY